MWAIEIEARHWEEKTKDSFAVLPTGSFEYHGPQAPLGTDSYLSNHFAAFLAKQADMIVYPNVSYTACPGKTAVHSPTISISPDTMLRYYIDIMNAIKDAGLNKLIVLNSHDANMALLRAAAESITGDFKMLLINWWQLLSQSETQDFFSDGGRGHGGAYELSATWAAMRKYDEVGESIYNLPAHKHSSNCVCIESQPSDFKGYAGKIEEASGKKGREILVLAENKLTEEIENWKRYIK